jgi:hypothetical protein
MASATDIKAAVELLDVADDNLWEANGVPKLSVIRATLKDETVQASALQRAIGDFRRPVKNPEPAKEEAKVETPAPIAAASTEREDNITVPPAPTSTERLLAQVEAARVRRDELGDEMAAERTKRDEAARRLHELAQLQNKEIAWLEANEPQVTQAEAVKRVQAQTVARLAGGVAASHAMADILKATGQKVFPSVLDQSLAMRKQTPEQKANYAKFVHQTAAHRAGLG